MTGKRERELVLVFLKMQNANKVLTILDETEQDIQNYLDRGQCYLPKAEADNIDRGLNNSGILRKPNSIIVLLFIL